MCAERSSALLQPWDRGEQEGGEQVAYLVIVFKRQQDAVGLRTWTSADEVTGHW